MLVQIVEVIALHGHIVELQEAQTLFHSLLEALRSQHVVYGETAADLTNEINIVQVQQPVSVVDHLCLPLAKLNKALHLLLEAITVVLDGLLSHHRPHIRTAGGVSDHSSTTANEGNGLIASHLQPLHQAQCHKVSNMERVSRGIKANIERSLAVVDHLADLFFIGHLGDQAAGNQFIIQFHFYSSKICF